jgi:autotransporter-associated beta strand protein
LASSGTVARTWNNAVSLEGDVVLTAADTFTGAVTLSGAVDLGNAARTLTVNTAATLSGVVGGVGGSLTKAGSGTLTLSGSNTYTGATTINAGVLEAAHANALGTNASVTVNGGSLLVSADGSINSKNLVLNSNNTLVAGLAFSSSYNGTAGTLTLTQNSIIDLGDAPAGVVLRFSDIVGLADYALSIYNWTGTTLWGGTDRNNTDQIYVTADLNAPARAGELANIQFYSGFGTGFLGDGFQLTGSGFNNNQVIPVPETGVWVTGSFLLLGLGLQTCRTIRRRRMTD